MSPRRRTTQLTLLHLYFLSFKAPEIDTLLPRQPPVASGQWETFTSLRTLSVLQECKSVNCKLRYFIRSQGPWQHTVPGQPHRISPTDHCRHTESHLEAQRWAYEILLLWFCSRTRKRHCSSRCFSCGSSEYDHAVCIATIQFRSQICR